MSDPVSEDVAALAREVAALKAQVAEQLRRAFVASMPLVVPRDDGITFVMPKLHRMRCPVAPPDGRPLREFDDETAAVTWLDDAFDEWARCDLCLPDEVSELVPSGDRQRLSDLLAWAHDADPMHRIEYRDPIARFGAQAIEAIIGWLVDEHLAAFAVRVIERAAPHAPDLALATLRQASMAGPAAVRDDAQAAVKRLGDSLPPWPRVAIDAGTAAFVGDGPFTAADMRLLAPDLRLIHEPNDGTSLDWVIVGHTADVAAIRHLTQQLPRPARFLPQEGWVDLVVFGHDWWLDDPERLNQVVDRHSALKVIRDGWPVAWRWPGVEPPGTGDPGDPVLDAESDLHRLGYQITGTTREERWEILKEAVDRLGLHHVAATIASFVKLRKLQSGGRHKFRYAIGEWESDLARLKATYYTGRSGFPWPGTEPD